jgi:peroxiredoxin
VHPRIGTPADLPALVTADGLPVSRESLAGGPVVVEFFFEGCEPCTRTMPEVATGIARFTDAHAASHAGIAPKVRHLAVSADEKAVTDAALRSKLAEFGGVGELVRDPDVVAARALGIESLPATVILTGDGTIAYVLVGPHGPIADDVAATLTAVAAGTPTGPLVRERYERRLRSYRRELDRASGTGTVEPLPEQVIAPRRQPVRFKLEPAWRAERVAMPGNLVCLDAAQDVAEPRIVVLDGWRTVVELDAEGHEVARHELELPRDTGVGFLRTATDAAGRRWWLAGARGGQHVFVFDADWKKQATYPEPGGAVHDGISDAEMGDLDGDDTPEIVVAYRGSVGVQAATLEGKRLWRDRSLGSVIDVALGPPAPAGERRDVLCVTGAGRLARATPDADEPATASGADRPTLKGVSAGPVAPDAAWALVGIEGAAVGEQAAVGLDPASLAETWRLPLAEGVHRAGPIEPIAWADLLGTPRRQWLIAAPDGSVTVAWADGRVVDRYFHGRPLVGLGGYRHDGRSFVVLATRGGLEALRVDDVALD